MDTIQVWLYHALCHILDIVCPDVLEPPETWSERFLPPSCEVLHTSHVCCPGHPLEFAPE
eukprot:8700669-Prorocentrum_lima.AAC.1